MFWHAYFWVILYKVTICFDVIYIFFQWQIIYLERVSQFDYFCLCGLFNFDHRKNDINVDNNINYLEILRKKGMKKCLKFVRKQKTGQIS